MHTNTITNSKQTTPKGSGRGRLIIAGLVATGIMFGTAGVASASTSTSTRLETKRAQCVSEIDRRVTALGSLTTRVDGARRLTSDQKASIDANIAAVVANLNDVNRPAVTSATTKATLAAACSAIYTDNRVFVVVIPQVVFVAYGDALGNFVDKLTEKAAEQAATGVDVSSVTTHLDAASVLISSAATKNASVTVAGFNADPAGTRATFDSVRSDLYSSLMEVIAAKQALDALP